MRKRTSSQGLDQLGPTQHWREPGQLNMPDNRGGFRTLNSRIKCSATARKVKVTLPDHNSLKRLLEED
jgi:hypothetical protein